TKPDTEVDLLVWRDGKEITIKVTIEKQPKNFFDQRRTREKGFRWDTPEEEGPTTIETMGMTVEPMSAELAKRYGWDYDDEDIRYMLMVTEVESLGEAQTLLIRPGYLIIGVQGKRIKSGSELKEALSKEAIKEGVRIRILTQSRPITLFYQDQGIQ
ncbi:MAG: hypothetical protein JSV03_07930, partial [Planctomycetota bacterium]